MSDHDGARVLEMTRESHGTRRDVPRLSHGTHAGQAEDVRRIYGGSTESVTPNSWRRAIRGRVPSTSFAVAHALANYAKNDGSNAHPGVERLAADGCLSEKSVDRALKILREAGWIDRTHAGSRRRGLADTYRLTIPEEAQTS